MNSSSSAVASSSSPSPLLSIIPLQKYDVFISFRGPDTRNDFTSHLHAALCRKQIYTFIDDGLPKGDPISTLFPIIESSKFSVIIFSQHYASSKWCLNELVKILECRKTRGQRVIPVFYNVDPSNVKNQTGSYAKSFAEKHEGKQTPEIIQIWRNTLREAARLVGWNTADTRPDALLTEKIAEDIWMKLNHMSSSYNKDLVGIDSKIEVIESMLSLGSMDRCVVGINGIGGIGKTTLAQATINKISIEFQDVYFIDNIRETSKRIDGLSSLRKDLFSSFSGAIAKTGFILNFTLARFCRKKIIIVFDDVSDPMQVEEIVGPLQNWDNTGSLFIVTSRDKQVLQNLCDEKKIYKLSGLFDDEALQLFNQYAFKQEFLIEKHMDLSKEVVKYTGGVPLALKVLASYLCGRSEQEWKSALEKLEEIPHVKIQDVLKISYDGLEEDQKNLFLDFACFFQLESRNFLVAYFIACGFKAEIELAILIDKCLIEIKPLYSVITMHDMIRRMGREIVRQESNDEPSKRSRLWHHKDIKKVLSGNTGTEVIKGISLDMSMIDDINLKSDAFEKMKKLRFLNFYGTKRVHMPWGLDSILNELRHLRWDGFPLKSLQPNFNPANLVHLDIRGSNIKQLWGDGQPLSNLLTMMLTRCKELTEIPNPFEAQKLQQLDIQDCASLSNLPSWAHLKFLTHVRIESCPKLEIIPELPSNLNSISLSGIAIEEFPSSIGYLSRLEILSIGSCPKLKSLPDICKLTSLQTLTIRHCEKLKRLPHDLGDSEALRDLVVLETAIEVMPSSICKLKSLEQLRVSYNEKLARLPHDIGDLESLQGLDASITAIEELPSSICKLKSLERLQVSGNKKLARLPHDIEDLKSLRDLDASNTSIEELPSSICKLKSLEVLEVSDNEKLARLPHDIGDLESLRDLDASITAIEELPSSICKLKSLEQLRVSYNEKLARLPHDIGDLESLEELDASGTAIEELPSSICKLKSLEVLEVSGNKKLARLPHDIGDLESLLDLGASDTALEELPSSICKLKSLEQLRVSGNKKLARLPHDIGDLESLGDLDVSGTAIEELSSSICKMKSLKAYVIYLGSRIPKWFSYQRIGSLITLELTLRSHNREIAGIAICVVVNLPWSKIGFHYKFEEEYDRRNVGTSSLVPKYQSLHVYHGYHVCIVYDPCQKFLSQLNKSLSQLKSITVSFEFYVERKESLEETVTCFDVEACGIRFLYGQNLRKRNRDSSSVDEELGSPNKKVRGCTNEDYIESFSMVVDSLSSLKIL